MSPAFESFLARLYVDVAARTRFLADPRAEAAAAGLADDEIAAAVRIDRVGLELAAAGFAHKRRRRQRKRFSISARGALVPLWRWVTKRVTTR
jgi:hypothetical protein